MSAISAGEMKTDGDVESKVPNGKRGWVKFEEDDNVSTSRDVNNAGETHPAQAAVLRTETVQVNLERSTDSVPEADSRTPPQRNVEFIIQQGFTNGEVLVTLLPVNTKWPWITPAQFKPELVPEELMAQGLTLTVEEYVHAMELLVNDVRFTLYNVCYKRVLVCWITLAFVVLLALLFSGLTGLTLFTLGVMWLILNAAAIFVCMWVKLKLSKGLEQCLASVNKLLTKHKLVMALDDRGRLSCHKVNLCFLYMDSAPCITHLQRFIQSEEGSTLQTGWENRLDVTANDIVIQGQQQTRLSRKQGTAEAAFLRYLQRWGKDYLRRRLDWTLDEESSGGATPRHLSRAICPCQYIEEILHNKTPKDQRACFPLCNNWLRRRGID